MYKLIGIEPVIPESTNIFGYVKSETQYVRFTVIGDVVTLGRGVDKTKYKSYEHYAAVMGKFVPEVIYFKKRIPLPELSRKVIEAAEREANAV